MAIGTRSYCPVYPFIVAIKMGTLGVLSRAFIVVIEMRATTYCCFTFLCVMASWHQKRFDRGRPFKCEVNTHGTPGGGVWPRPSVCMMDIGTRCRRGANRQGSEAQEY